MKQVDRNASEIRPLEKLKKERQAKICSTSQKQMLQGKNRRLQPDLSDTSFGVTGTP